MASEKCCENCAFWTRYTGWTDDNMGKCECGFDEEYIPNSIYWERLSMFEYEGTNCRCFEAIKVKES